jgi:hypothetical protein
MRVVFHIISTGGGGGGVSRTTRYIAEREKDPTREGPGPRPLFSEDRDGLTYRKADRILDPVDGQPQKDDLMHLSVSFQEEDFEKLGKDEKERQAGLRRVIREGMKGMAEELNVEGLTWVAGIHRNSENPHAHIVLRNQAVERGAIREKPIGRIRTSLLPHKQIVDGKEVIVPGKIGDRFLGALDRQQDRFLEQNQDRTRARDAWEELSQDIQTKRSGRESFASPENETGDDKLTRQFKSWRNAPSHQTLDQRSMAASWREGAVLWEQYHSDYRIALGKHLEFSLRLAFAEVWHERAVKHGDTFRFNVIDQTTNEERKISELDVHRRASARAQRTNAPNRAAIEQAFEADLSQHRETLDQLLEAREAKIAALGKDVGSLRGTVGKIEQVLMQRSDTPSEKRLIPILSRQTLSELQETAVRLNLAERVGELEKLRVALAREYKAPTRTDDEAAMLTAQANVARADLMARNERLEKFEASVHLTPYEVHGERWSLAALDKQISRRREDSKFVPERAMRLDVRSLTRFNYSTAEREKAATEVEHLTFLRGEVARQINQRRESLISDRDLARDMSQTLEDAYDREQHTREREGKEMPEPKYEPYQIRALEASAETLRDSKLLREVDEWEKTTFKNDRESSWEGRAVARETMAEIGVQETKERLQHFLESKRSASLNLGDHRTGTLREVEARTLTDYLARAIESRQERDHRHSINLAAREHHGRLVSDFEKAKDYYATARELASEARGSEPQFTDKERINLEIFAELQNDEMTRQQYLELARSENTSEHEVAVSLSR